MDTVPITIAQRKQKQKQDEQHLNMLNCRAKKSNKGCYDK